MRWIVVVLTMSAAGCGLRLVDPCAGVAGTCLAIQVEPSATVKEVDELALRVAGAGVEMHKIVSSGKLLTLPVAVGVKLDSLPRSTVSMVVTVVGIRGVDVDGYGDAVVELTSGQRQAVTVRLDATAPTANTDLGPEGEGDGGLGLDQPDGSGLSTDLASPTSCPGNQALCPLASGARACVDTANDSMNCGTCGMACINGSICSGGACVTSLAFPTNDAGGYTAARSFDLTLQSLGPATIYYTLDGSTPTAASPNHGPSPLNVTIAAGGVVKWLTSADPTLHTHNVAVDPSLQSQIGELADQVRFDKTQGPIVFASPGEALTGLINDEAWGGQGYCPSCVRVFGIGILAVEQCLGAIVPAAWPGTTWTNFQFTVHAPSKPGIYHLRRGVNLDFQCYPGTPVGSDDGVVIVQ